MSWAARLTVAAGVLAAALAAVAAAARGTGGAAGSLAGSALACLAQVAAVGLLQPAMGARTPAFMRRWAAGMAIRGGSAVLLAVLVLVARGTLPALWTVVGYFGVLLPLLFVETRYLR